MRILIVDDEPTVLASVSQTLRVDGHAVQTAANAEEALLKFDLTEFDLALVDLQLTGMQGDGLAREMNTRQPRMPVVLVSGHPIRKPLPGTALVLLKPFSIGELRETVALFA